eukprot:g20492.t1
MQPRASQMNGHTHSHSSTTTSFAPRFFVPKPSELETSIYPTPLPSLKRTTQSVKLPRVETDNALLRKSVDQDVQPGMPLTCVKVKWGPETKKASITRQEAYDQLPEGKGFL